MLKVWIARDKAHNKLKIFTKRPERGAWHLPESQRQFWYVLITNEDRCDYGRLSLPPDDPWGQDLTWEDPPRELNLVEIGEVEALREKVEKYKRALERMAVGWEEGFDCSDCEKSGLLPHCKPGGFTGECAKAIKNHYLAKAEQELKTNQS